MSVQSDGKIIAAGSSYNGTDFEFALARYGVSCFQQSLDPIIVTNINDSGEGSLRGAIDIANSSPDQTSITFNIPGPGPYTVNLLSSLPPINTPMSIDATTQPGYIGSPIIEINGTSMQPGVAFNILSGILAYYPRICHQPDPGELVSW